MDAAGAIAVEIVVTPNARLLEEWPAQTFVNCVFDGCEAMNGNAHAIYSESTIGLQGCIFRNMMPGYAAMMDSAAIRFTAVDALQGSEMVNCTFTEVSFLLSSQGGSGIFFATRTDKSNTCRQYSFVDVTGDHNGCVFGLVNARALKGCMFEKCSGDRSGSHSFNECTASSYGGAMSATGSSIVIDDCTFTGVAASNGQAINIDLSSD